MGDYIAVIGIVVSVLLALVLLLLGIIGYFVAQWMRSIRNDVACLPTIQIELAGMKERVNQHTEKQDDFCELQEEFGKRLIAVEMHISNQERIAVLEKSVKTAEGEIEKLRPVVHKIPTMQQTIDQLVAETKCLAGLQQEVAALSRFAEHAQK